MIETKHMSNSSQKVVLTIWFGAIFLLGGGFTAYSYGILKITEDQLITYIAIAMGVILICFVIWWHEVSKP